MARIFIDGFEAGDLKLWVNSGCSVATGVSGMDGTYCAYLSSSNHFISRALPARSEYYFAFRYRAVSGDSQSIISFYFNGTRQCFLARWNSDYCLRAYRQGNNLLANGLTPVINGNTYLIEVYIKPGSSTGIFQVKINGIMEIDFTGNVCSGSSIDAVRIGYYDNFAYSGFYVDNIVVDDAAWPGSTKIQAIVPAGAGNSTQWTPSAGNNYECVDEVPPSESDYIEADAIDQLDQYAMENLSGAIGSIRCVQAQALSVMEGTPDPQNLQFVVRTGGSDFVSDSKEVPVDISKQIMHIWEKNPDTEATWQASEVNAMEIGIKAVA